MGIKRRDTDAAGDLWHAILPGVFLCQPQPHPCTSKEFVEATFAVATRQPDWGTQGGHCHLHTYSNHGRLSVFFNMSTPTQLMANAEGIHFVGWVTTLGLWVRRPQSGAPNPSPPLNFYCPGQRVFLCCSDVHRQVTMLKGSHNRATYVAQASIMATVPPLFPRTCSAGSRTGLA